MTLYNDFLHFKYLIITVDNLELIFLQVFVISLQ